MRWAHCFEFGICALWLPPRFTNEGLGWCLAFAVRGVDERGMWSWAT